MFRQLLFCLTAIILVASTTYGASGKYAKGNYVPPDRIPAENEVRAELVKDSSQFIGGPKREARVGDFKMFNNRAGFVIAGTRLQSGIFMYGGIVEEAGILKPEGNGARWYNLMGDTSFFVYKGADPTMGGRMLAPVKAEILKDGSDGEAIVRIFARDAEWPERKEVITIDSPKLKIKAIIDYILQPDSPVLEMKLTFINGKSKKQVLSVGQLYLMGDGSSLFAPGHGFNISAADGKEFPIFTAVGGGVSYGWFPQEGNMQVNKTMNRRLITTFGKVKLPPKEEVPFSMYLAVGDGGSSIVAKTMYTHNNQSGYGEVSGKCVTSGSGEPAADAVIHALSPDGAMAANTDVRPDGGFSLALPPGKYSLQAASYNRDTPGPVEIEVVEGNTAETEIVVAPPAVLEYKITDDSGTDIPATVSFKRVSKDSSKLNSSFYYNRTSSYGAGFFKIHFAGPDPGSVAIRPGEYEVYFSRGLEYEFQQQEISLVAGETISARASLSHVVDTTGYLNGDFHIHSQPSNDTSDLVYDKMSAAAALGLEIPIATDHDVNTDYAPYIKELGLQDYLKSIVGDELTTIFVGHFNAYPLTFDPGSKNWGAPMWFGLSVPEIMEALRDDPQDNTIIQVNHPRSKGGGYFNVLGYDPETGTAVNQEQFTLDFDGMEVLNGTGYDGTQKSVLDWYSFLNRGKPVIGLGNSDNHSTYSLGLGYPRNYVVSTTDSPAEMVEDEFIAAVRAQEVSVCGGAFITVNANGQAGPGGTVTDTDGEIELNVKVQAPSWVETKTLTVVAGGEEVQTIDLSGEESAVRFDGKITHKPGRDTWYVIRVEGEKNLFPVYGHARPYSFTNPVYVDTDGNGKYDPPLAFTDN